MEAKFYQVGGCVRDLLMGLKSKDIDFSVEADSYDAMRSAIVERCGGNPDAIKVETPQHFTIRAVCPKLGGVDFVLCRKEGAYSDGRRPDSVERGTLFDDLSRRDFTMNAIAMADNGELIDPFNGVDAIQRRVIQCVGDTEKRLTEDSLRMLRAIRFSITKRFSLGGEVEAFLSKGSNAILLRNISAQRIREELNKCFSHDTAQTLNVLGRYVPIRDEIFVCSGITLDATLKKR